MKKLKYHCKSIVYRIPTFVKTIYYFCKHGWQFRNIRYWDNSYILQSLDILLGNFEREFSELEEHPFSYKGIEKDVKSIKVTRQLLKRLTKEEYYTPYESRFNASLDYMWDNRKEIKVTDKYTEVHFPDEELYVVYRDLHHKREQALKEQDLELLIKIFKTKILKLWW